MLSESVSIVKIDKQTAENQRFEFKKHYGFSRPKVTFKLKGILSIFSKIPKTVIFRDFEAPELENEALTVKSASLFFLMGSCPFSPLLRFS